MLLQTELSSATIQCRFGTCISVCPRRVNSANCSLRGYVGVTKYIIGTSGECVGDDDDAAEEEVDGAAVVES